MDDIRYAFFDFDGTLVDSMYYWRNIMNEYLEQNGEGPITEEDQRALDQLRFASGVRYFLEHYTSDWAQAFTAKKGKELLAVHYQNDVLPRKGVPELLRTLWESGTRMAIITATPRELAEQCLERCGLKQYFSFVLDGEGFPGGKHSPDIFLHAAERLGCKVEEAWMFEDALYSARTAKTLGMRVAVVEDKYQSHCKDTLMELADRYYTDGVTVRIK